MTGATAAVSGLEVLRQQVRMTQYVLRLNTEGVTHQESLIQPEPDGNCLNWVVGHLACVYNNVLPLVGQEPVMDADALKRYDRGSPPLRDPAEAIELGELLAAFDRATERLEAGLAALTADDLERPAPFSPGGDPDETVRSLLATVTFHQAYHAGQTGILRRIVGKEGAVR